MRVDVSNLFTVMDRVAEARVENQMARAQNGAARRETAHARQMAERQRAQEAAEESSFWGDLAEVCTWGMAAGAIVATGCAGTAGALALGGAGAMVLSEGARRARWIDPDGGLATGLAVGSGLAVGVAGGMGGKVGKLIVTTAGLISGGATLRAAMADARAGQSAASATRFRAEVLELSAQVREDLQDVTDALEARSDIQDHAAGLLLRRPIETLRG